MYGQNTFDGVVFSENVSISLNFLFFSTKQDTSFE